MLNDTQDRSFFVCLLYHSNESFVVAPFRY